MNDETNDEKIDEEIDDTHDESGESKDMDEETPSTERVEGEGSYTATRKYNADLENALRKGNSEDLAEKAPKALEGPDRKELEQAESVGKARRKARAPGAAQDAASTTLRRSARSGPCPPTGR
jgi:hypothetical protein